MQGQYSLKDLASEIKEIIKMQMIPPISNKGATGTEREVFDLLAQISLENAIVLSSLNLSSHEYKKWGEIDFVVVSKFGLLALEVKGGQVYCDGGIWKYESRDHSTVERAESPMAQASSAYFALRSNHLYPAIGNSAIDAVPTGFGVILARTTRREAEFRGLLGGSEMPPALVGTKEDLEGPEQLEALLKRMVNYWKEQMRREPRKWGPREITKVVRALRPWFDRVAPLSISLIKVREEQFSLTTEQYQILDFSHSASRLVCTGGAGCGKTLLAIECLRREIHNDPIFVTGTESLARHLRASHVGDPSRIYSILELERTPTSKRRVHGCLIVDEGQQITNSNAFAVLSTFLEGGLENGRWRWFCDPNNQVLSGNHFDEKQFNWLQQQAFPGKLTKNCRTTPQIAHTVQLLTGAKIGDSTSKGQGPEVIFAEDGPLESRIAGAAKIITGWLEDSAIHPGDIVLLSPKGEMEWSIPMVAKAAGLQWRDWKPDWASSRDYQSCLAATSVEEFRGMESPFVVLCDMDSTVAEPFGKFYIAMTRANFGLMVLAEATVIRDCVVKSSAVSVTN